MAINYPPPDATREDIDRFFGVPLPTRPPQTNGVRTKLRVYPSWQYMVAVHHTIDEIDALESR